ncbi:MAG TPA: CHAT domain-containing protein [Kofleriaceae bacterium]|nr:CHAT domain-containing protein [Kofleriaceae bacterium]
MDVFAGQHKRFSDMRFALAEASVYKPLPDVVLGAEPASAPADRISHAAISKLEKRGDRHAVVIAQVWNGQKPADALAELRTLPQTDAVRADRAALEAMMVSDDHLQGVQAVLAELEALRRSSDPAVARSARWNYALVLAKLGLQLSAAAELEAIGYEGEPGWAGEALRRAKAQSDAARALRRTLDGAEAAAKLLVEGGPAPRAELVAARPGLIRASFYQAIRTATTAERVASLAPLAAALDSAGDPGQHTLRDYVERVQKLDFKRRAPFARAFAAMLTRASVPEPIATQLVTESDSDDVADIIMGAMFERNTVAGHRDWFLRMARRASDPWLEVVLAFSIADAELARGNTKVAEAAIRDAAPRCAASVALTYPCVRLERRFGRLYADLHRVVDAERILQPALHRARGVVEVREYRLLLNQAADTERFRAATALVRAYENEILRLGDPNAPDGDCRFRGMAHRMLAGAAVLDLDGPGARRYLTEALKCSEHNAFLASLLTDVARLEPGGDDLAELEKILGDARAKGLTPPDALLADVTEGRLRIERQPARGAELLNAAIATADRVIASTETNPTDAMTARKARAGAYTVLALDAARAGNPTLVLDLIAQDLGLPTPAGCTVGLVAEGGRSAVVVRDAAGHDRAPPDLDRRPSSAPPKVPDDLARGLSSCARVTVMAPAALQGRPRVLPPELAWSYATGPHAVPSTAAEERRALVVKDVKPPADLGLAVLDPLAPDDQPATTLSGVDATPTRVALAMTDVNEIHFHTHALTNPAISDAAFLALSPEPRGDEYALTAEAVSKLKLQAHPLVVLAACNSAQGAHYEHAPLSLPAAFIFSGARAVFATTTDIPDRNSGQFFARVLERVRHGADPAAALRDQRIESMAAQPWVADVILFD